MTAVEIRCDLCGYPTDGYCCRPCTAETAEHLYRAADLAPEVETTVALLARYAHRGGHRAAPDDDGERPTAWVNRNQPVRLFGWPASVTRPERGGLRPQRLPVDLGASARATHAFADLAAWAQTVVDDRGGTLPPTAPGWHPAADAARYLLAELDWIRHQQFAATCFQALRAAGAAITGVVDSPPERQVVGRCDCQQYLYAYAGASTCTCAECGLRWDVETSRNGLRQAMLDRMVTASEAGLLLAIFGIAGSRRRHAKTITMWAQRGLIAVHPPIDDAGPLFLFSDVFDRFAVRQAA